MTGKNVIVFESEYAKPEVIGVGNVYKIIITEETVGSDVVTRFRIVEMSNVKGIVRKCT